MSNIEIIIFKIQGCEACSEYVPRFRKQASAYENMFPVHVVDANANDAQELANYYGVKDVPVTLVRRKGNPNVLQYVGGLSDANIQWILAVAAKYS